MQAQFHLLGDTEFRGGPIPIRRVVIHNGNGLDIICEYLAPASRFKLTLNAPVHAPERIYRDGQIRSPSEYEITSLQGFKGAMHMEIIPFFAILLRKAEIRCFTKAHSTPLKYY